MAVCVLLSFSTAMVSLTPKFPYAVPPGAVFVTNLTQHIQVIKRTSKQKERTEHNEFNIQYITFRNPTLPLY